MTNLRFILLLLSAVFFFQSCQKDETSDDDILNEHLSKCPGKFEGQYIGNLEEGSYTYSNVTITVLTYPNDPSKITFVFDNVFSDTISGTIVECDLRSFTFQYGFGSFSEDGNTLTFNYSTYWNSGQGTFTKIKNNGFLMIVPYYDYNGLTVPVGQSVEVPIRVKRFGSFSQDVTLRVDSIYPNDQNDLTASFSPSQSKPHFDAALTITAANGAPASYQYVTISAISGADVSSADLIVKVYDGNCTSLFTGNFSCSCDWDDFNDYQTVSITALSSTEIQIHDLIVPGSEFIVEVDCANETAYIPPQAFTIDYPPLGGIIDFEIAGTGGQVYLNEPVRLYIHWSLSVDGNYQDGCFADLIKL